MPYLYCSPISLVWLKLYRVSNIFHHTVPQLFKYAVVEKFRWKGPLWVFYCSLLGHNSHQTSVYDSMSNWVSQPLRKEIPHCLQEISPSPSALPRRTILKIFNYNFLCWAFWPLSFPLMHLSDEKDRMHLPVGDSAIRSPLLQACVHKVPSDTLFSRFSSPWSP